jgi:hypothetical protein
MWSLKYNYSKPAAQCCMLEVMFHPMSQSDKHPDNFSAEEENISLKEDQLPDPGEAANESILLSTGILVIRHK